MHALKNLIAETDCIIETILELPRNHTPRCRENLKAVLALTDDLLK